MLLLVVRTEGEISPCALFVCATNIKYVVEIAATVLPRPLQRPTLANLWVARRLLATGEKLEQGIPGHLKSSTWPSLLKNITPRLVSHVSCRWECALFFPLFVAYLFPPKRDFRPHTMQTPTAALDNYQHQVYRLRTSVL
mgnify:FL=1